MFVTSPPPPQVAPRRCGCLACQVARHAGRCLTLPRPVLHGAAVPRCARECSTCRASASAAGVFPASEPRMAAFALVWVQMPSPQRRVAWAPWATWSNPPPRPGSGCHGPPTLPGTDAPAPVQACPTCPARPVALTARDAARDNVARVEGGQPGRRSACHALLGSTHHHEVYGHLSSSFADLAWSRSDRAQRVGQQDQDVLTTLLIGRGRRNRRT